MLLGTFAGSVPLLACWDHLLSCSGLCVHLRGFFRAGQSRKLSLIPTAPSLPLLSMNDCPFFQHDSVQISNVDKMIQKRNTGKLCP